MTHSCDFLTLRKISSVTHEREKMGMKDNGPLVTNGLEVKYKYVVTTHLRITNLSFDLWVGYRRGFCSFSTEVFSYRGFLLRPSSKS